MAFVDIPKMTQMGDRWDGPVGRVRGTDLCVQFGSHSACFKQYTRSCASDSDVITFSCWTVKGETLCGFAPHSDPTVEDVITVSM